MLSLYRLGWLLISLSSLVLLSSCQNATQRSVKAQMGLKDSKSAKQPLTEAQKKVDEAMKSDKIIVCSSAFIKNQTALESLMNQINQKVTEHQKEKIDEALKTELTNQSLELKKQSDVQIAELVKNEAAGCKSTKTILMIDIKTKVNNTLIAAADLIGTDNAASKEARQEKKRLEGQQKNQSLVNQTFKISKDLSLALDEESLTQKVHFVAGRISRGQTNIDILTDENLRSFCVLTAALQKKVSEEAQMTVLSLLTSVSEKPFEPGSQKITQVSKVALQVGIEDQVISLDCRLSKTAKISKFEVEFKDVFGELIQSVD